MDLIILLLNLIAWIVFWVTIIITGLFVVRVLLTWANVNPFSWIFFRVTQLTEPLVRPLRYMAGGRVLRYDLMPLIAGVLVLVTGLFVYGMLSQISGLMSKVAAAMRMNLITIPFIAHILVLLLGTLYIMAIFLRFLLPYFGVGYRNTFHRVIFAATEPLLRPLRRFFVAGMFDFSPLIAIILVQIVTGLVASLLYR